MHLFTASQISEIRRLRNNGPINGNYSHIYEYIASILPQGTPEQRWFSGAAEANAGRGIYSAAIRGYSEAQMRLRGIANSPALMQEASNEVARLALADILGENLDTKNLRVPDVNGNVLAPTISNIAMADAVGVGNVLFSSIQTDSAFKQNSGWAGALFFSGLGEDQTYRLFGAGGATGASFDTLDDLRNILFSRHSLAASLKAAVAQGIAEFGVALNFADMTLPQRAKLQFLTDMGIGWDFIKNINLDDFLKSNSIFATFLPSGSVLRGFAEEIKQFSDGQILDMLRRSLHGNSIAPTISDSVFETNALALFSELGNSGEYGLVKSSGSLSSVAKTDFSALIALHAASLFQFTGANSINVLTGGNSRLYEKWLEDQAGEEESTGTIHFSEHWRADRALLIKAMQDGRNGNSGSDAQIYLQDKSLDLSFILPPFGFFPDPGGGNPSIPSTEFVLFGGEDSDELSGFGGNDRLYGGNGNDQIDGAGGEDFLEGNDGNDLIDGGEGNDKLFGGDGDDDMTGGDGDDSLSGGAGEDILSGGNGNDTLKGGDGKDLLNGYADNDLLEGGKDKDLLYGGSGDDVLKGGDDDDLLDGGVGADVLIGGDGFDSYSADNGDTIRDSDGNGSVRFNDKKLHYAFRKKGQTVYRDKNGNTFSLNGENLYVNGGSGSLVIEGFANGQLGIYLDEQRDDPPTPIPPPPPRIPVYDPRSSYFRLDPLALDLNGNGRIDTIGSNRSSAYFDFNGDSIFERTGWIAPGDGLLAVDTNRNGAIDGLSELFGTQNTTGFADLKLRMDSNGDNLIDGNDDGFSSLRVWRDANGDGIAQAGELATLSDLGITAIELVARTVNIADADNLIKAVGSFKQDGQNRVIADVELMVDFSDTDSNPSRPLDQELQLDADVYSLPWLRGYGFVKSLHHAYQDDLSLRQAAAALSGLSREAMFLGFEKFFRKWTGLDAAHQAQGIYHDVLRTDDKVWIMANLTGGQNQKTEVERSLFNGGRWSDAYVNRQYAIFENRAALGFVMQATAKNWLAGTYYSLEQDGFVVVNKNKLLASLSVSLKSINNKYDADFAALLLARLKADDVQIDYAALKRELADSPYAQTYNNAIDFHGYYVGFLMSPGNLVTGSHAGAYLVGSDGADTLYDGNSDDVLDGRSGNDDLIGGSGSDVYLYRRGDGDDVITEDYYDHTAKDTDILRFDKSIKLADIQVHRDQNNLYLTIAGGGKITLKNMVSNGGIERIEFFDGTVLSENDLIAMSLKTTEEGDFLWAGSRDDTLFGAGGGDTLKGDSGDDSLDGGVGNDMLEGGSGDDSLDGGIGNDMLEGESGNDVMDGGEGDDTLVGNEGNDLLVGGIGNDVLDGGYGSDVYVIGRGDGVDVVIEKGSNWGDVDILRFDASLSLADIQVHRDLKNLYLTIAGGGQVTIRDWASSGRIERTEFADGSVLDYDDLISLSLHVTQGGDFLWAGSRNDLLTGQGGDDTMMGDAGDDTLMGDSGNDAIDGGNGKDIIDGGIGNDTLEGGYENDIYLYRRGDGSDTIEDGGGNTDTLRFDASITIADVEVTRDFNHLYLHIAGSDVITLRNWAQDNRQIDFVEFSDGTVWNVVDLVARSLRITDQDDVLYGGPEADSISGADGNDTLLGYKGNDVLDGGDGNDVLDGGEGYDTLRGGAGNDLFIAPIGSDTYLFGRGDGNDTIETPNWGHLEIRFDESIAATEVAVARDAAGRMYLTFASGNEKIQLNGGFLSNKDVTLQFADGTVLHMPDLIMRSLLATDSNDFLSGSDQGDTLYGAIGNDTLIGAEGADTLVGGVGNDLLDGGNGSDIYLFKRGDGVDTISDTSQDAYRYRDMDKLRFDVSVPMDDIDVTRDAAGLHLKIRGSDDEVVLAGWSNTYTGIDRVEFADGRFWTVDDLLMKDGSNGVSATRGNDLIIGKEGSDVIVTGAGSDTLDGGQGADLLRGGSGSDLYLFKVGDGMDRIIDEDFEEGNIDIVRFDSSVLAEYVKVTRDNSNIYLNYGAGTDRITLERWLERPSYRLERIEFSNGVAWSAADLNALAFMGSSAWDVIRGSSDDDIISGLEGADYLYGDIGDDVIRGGADNDHIEGGAGDDTIDGGAGDDLLDGGSGSNLFLYKQGDGDDSISLAANALGGDYTTLRFDASISKADISIMRMYDGIYLIMSGGDKVWLRNWSSPSWRGVIEFADGGLWSGKDVAALTLIGNDGVNFLYGYETDDFVSGMGGADRLFGEGGDDTIDGGNGDDYLVGGGGNDLLLGMDGNDELLGNDGDDLLFGMDGDDRLSGSEGNDKIEGGAGDDMLFGQSGNDTLQGGSGNDVIDGGAGNDVFLFSRGDGVDAVFSGDGSDSSDVDTLRFDATINRTDVRVTSKNDFQQFELSFTGSNDRIKLGQEYTWEHRNSFPWSGRIEFSDGTSWSVSDLIAFSLLGSAENDQLVGSKSNDYLSGRDGSDILSGRDGNDTLDGGTGEDILSGGDGSDVYLFQRGGGKDLISDSQYDGQDINILRFDSSINMHDVVVTKDNQGVYLSISGTTDQITILNASWAQKDPTRGVQKVEFADGSSWSSKDLAWRAGIGSAENDILSGTYFHDILSGLEGNDVLDGGDGDDTLNGGAGDDVLYGSDGNDIYIFGRGDGSDVINAVLGGGQDTLRFGSDISESDISISRDDANLYISITGSEDRLQLLWWSKNDANRGVTKVEFADGTIWGMQDLINRSYGTASSGSDRLYGTNNADAMYGWSGDDTLNGAAGDDTLDGGSGNDWLDGGEGRNTYLLKRGDGSDLILVSNSSGTDIRYDESILPEEVSVRWQASSWRLQIAGSGDKIELYPGDKGWADPGLRVQFSNGTVWTFNELRAMAFAGTAGDDTIVGSNNDEYLSGMAGSDALYGDWGDDTLQGGSGDDQLDGANGSDTYLFGRGDGADTIRESEYTYKSTVVDTIKYDATVASTEVEVQRINDDLLLSISGTQDRVLVAGWFYDVTQQIERVEFADGTIWSIADLMRKSIYTDKSDVVEGAESAEIMAGLGGDDTLKGNGGDDTLDGGIGDDILSGGTGSDVYLYRRGDGRDVITAEIGDGDEADILRFDATLSVDDVHVGRRYGAPDDLFLTILSTGGAIRLANWLSNASARVSRVEFADGTAWNAADLQNMALTPTRHDDQLFGNEASDTLVGLEGNDQLWGQGGADLLQGSAGFDLLYGDQGDDVLDGGTGDDYLDGGTGNDLYLFNSGDGNDILANWSESVGESDVLFLRGGIAPHDVKVIRDRDNLMLTISGVDSVTVNGYFKKHGDGSGRDGEIRFADGTSWDIATVRALVPAPMPTEGDDKLSLYEPASIDGLGGDDTLEGVAGSVLKGGAGNDSLMIFTGGTARLDGGGGNDSLYVGDGSANQLAGGDGDDFIMQSKGNDNLLDGGAGADDVQIGHGDYNSLVGGGDNDSLRLNEGNFNRLDGEIGDDSLWVGRGDGNELLGGNGSDTLEGGGGNDNLFDGGDGDDSVRLNDGDHGNILRGGAGKDKLWADGGKGHVLDGGDDDDVLDANGGGHILLGGSGDDFLHFGGGSNNTLDGGAGNDTLDFGGGDGNLLYGESGDDFLHFGGGNNNTLDGGAGNDTLDFGGGSGIILLGGEGHDQLHLGGGERELLDGGAGDDILIFDGGAASSLLGGTGNDTLLLRSGQYNVLNGGDGDDLVQVQNGRVNMLFGGSGADTLEATGAGGFYDGGEGMDVLRGSDGNDIFLGAAGDDLIITGAGQDIVLANRGDGRDTVVSGGDGDKTLSIGGGVLYADLLFSRSGNDLLLDTSDSDQVTLRDWYAGQNGIVTLQMVIDGGNEYGLAPPSALSTTKIEQFDFSALAAAFDSARAENPSLSRWALSSSLLQFHLGGNDSEAIGGDLAYEYGKHGSLTGLSLNAVQAVMADPNFGSQRQKLSLYNVT